MKKSDSHSQTHTVLKHGMRKDDHINMKPDIGKLGLEEFLQKGCPVENGAEAAEVCLQLLQNLGSPDPQLRDGLTYTILAKLIMNEPSLTRHQLVQVLNVVINEDHLFYRIGETGKDSVFMRSFSILIVAAILERDNRDKVLEASDVQPAIEAVLRYGLEEADKRGYVVDKGWAHSVAHTSDAIDSCVLNRFATVEHRDLALDVLRHLVMADSYLVHDEDARLAFTVYRMIQYERVEQMILEDWLGGFAEKMYNTQLEPSAPGWNAQSFLRRLYLRLVWTETKPSLTEHVSTLLKSVDSLAGVD